MDLDSSEGLLEQVVTVREAARLTRKSDRRICQYLHEQRLRARQTEEGTWLIERRSLDPFLLPLKTGRPYSLGRSWK